MTVARAVLFDVGGTLVEEPMDSGAGFVELPGATTCVAAIHAEGARVGVVADLATPTAEGFRRACPALAAHFDHWTVGGDHGSQQPSVTALHAALAALDVTPAATLMVGDSLEHDIVPALSLGMGAIWLRRAEPGSTTVITVDPHAPRPPIPAEIVPEGTLVARTLSDVRRIALTWLWAERHGGRNLTTPLTL